MELKAMTTEEYQNILTHWGSQSWEELVTLNTKLAYKIANQFIGNIQFLPFDQDDLYSLALLGLVKAAKTFKPNTGNAFSTYATYVIRNELLRAIRDCKNHFAETISLNQEVVGIDGDVDEYLNFIPDTFHINDILEYVCLIDIVKQVLSFRNERDQKIIIDSWDGTRQNVLSKKYNISCSNVGRIIREFKYDLQQNFTL